MPEMTGRFDTRANSGTPLRYICRSRSPFPVRYASYGPQLLLVPTLMLCEPVTYERPML